MHLQLERYFKYGITPTDERAWESLKNLPGRGPDVTCESRFKIPIDEHRESNGRDDLTWIRPIPRIYDHKTSSNPERYAKDSQELRGDIQVNMYAYKTLLEYPEAPAVEVTHNNIATKGAIRSWLTEPTRLERSEVENNFRKYLKIIDEMTDVLGRECARDVPKTTDKNFCFAYGKKCHVKDRCDSAFLGRGKETVTPEVQAKIAELKAKQAGGAAPSKPAESPAATAAAKPSKPGKRFVEPEETEETPPPPKPVKAKTTPTPKAPEPEPQVEENAPDGADTSGTGCVVLINCVVESGLTGAVHLEKWIAPALEHIQTETGTNWQSIDYKKGCAMVEECIDQMELPEVLLIDGSSYLGKTCLVAILKRDDVECVIRGTQA